ncbi:MAG: OB-fold domain-containing protein [Acidimicrobiia bacterium]
MSSVRSIGTYLPRWGTDAARVCGPDEDAVTLAVAAGRGALRGIAPADVRRVVMVTRRPPLVDGGNGAALLAGLGLPAATDVVEQLGGGPAPLATLAAAADGTLVIGVDTEDGAGAAGALTGPGGARLEPGATLARSLPVRTRDLDGVVHDYDDPRLLRVRGSARAIEMVGAPGGVAAVTGLGARDAAALTSPGAPSVPTSGASAPLFAIAALAEADSGGTVLALEQASASVAELGAGGIAVHLDARRAAPLPQLRHHDGPDIAIALAGYDRAFDPKLRLEAARCPACGTLSYPPRLRCLECGSEEPTSAVELPRHGEVYTTTTIRVPVPSLATPYSLAIVELGETGVRLLVQVTGTPPGVVGIGDHGTLVFRLVAVRSGVPDYGYAFLPDEIDDPTVNTANKEVGP